MRRVLSFILALVICLGLVGTQAFAAGDKITWDYDRETDTLVISGSGEMEDYEDLDDAPWAKHSFECKKIIVEEGVERIGNNAFSAFLMLESVVLADSVETLGDSCFALCTALESVRFPAKLEDIEASAFSCCTNLGTLDLPSSLRRIDLCAFMLCESLQLVILPDGLKELSSDAFIGCENLRAIYLPSSVKRMDNANLLNMESLEYIAYGGSGEECSALLDTMADELTCPEKVYLDVLYYEAVEAFAPGYVSELDGEEYYIYTKDDSPIKILQTEGSEWFFLHYNEEMTSKEYYEYVPTFTNVNVASGEYGCWLLPATLADCVAYNLGTTVDMADKDDEKRTWRAMGGYYKDGMLNWRAGEEYDVKDGEFLEVLWEGSDITLAAVMLAPLNDKGTEFYAKSGYNSSLSPESLILVTSRLESARNYMRSLGLEEYLVE